MFIGSSDPHYSLTVDDYHTGKHLQNARRMADIRGLDDVLVVDVDSHHYETDNFQQIIELIDDEPLRQVALNMYKYKGASAVLDGRAERRLCLSVSHTDAVPRPASAERSGGRAGARLQSLHDGRVAAG